jgi:predicted peptidase
MIDTLNTIATKPKIFLVLPVPSWPNSMGIRDSVMQKIIPIIKDIGAKRGLWTIDVNTPLKRDSSYFYDGVHPLAPAADTIANVFYHAITGNPSSFRFVARSHTTSSGTLPYRLFYPYNYDPAKKYPLILTLHGAGESGVDNWLHIIKNRVAEIWADDTAQAKQNCFVVSPQCPTNHKWVEVAAWTDCYYSTQSIAQSIPLTIALAMLDSIKREFPIDTNRLYVTGLSMGGYGTWDFIARYPGKFAAAAPQSGGCDTSKASAIKNVPLWSFHGALDPTVPPNADRSMMRTVLPKLGVTVAYYTAQYASYFANPTITRNNLKTAIDTGARTLYCEYTDGAHDIWTQSFNDPLLEEWMFLQKKPSPDNTRALPEHSSNRVLNNFRLFAIPGNSTAAACRNLAPGVSYVVKVIDTKGTLFGRKAVSTPSEMNSFMRTCAAKSSGIRLVELDRAQN